MPGGATLTASCSRTAHDEPPLLSPPLLSEQVTKLIYELDMKTKEQKKAKYIKTGGVCVCRIAVERPICIETFTDVPALGRFTLRDEGRTIAIGKVTRIPKNH